MQTARAIRVVWDPEEAWIKACTIVEAREVDMAAAEGDPPADITPRMPTIPSTFPTRRAAVVVTATMVWAGEEEVIADTVILILKEKINVRIFLSYQSVCKKLCKK